MSITEHTTPSDHFTVHEAVARARALVPAIQQRATQAEALRRQPQETIQEIIKAGLVRLLMPKRWGGYELAFDALADSVIEIGKADASAAWCYSFLIVHSWLLALFPDGAQRDVWGEDPDAPTATSFVPAGKATPTDGGYRLSGNWPWSSGIDYCTWVMVAGAVFSSPDAAPEPRLFLLPHANYTIDDTWFVAGQKASGSKNVVVHDVFVPEYRTVRYADLREGTSPGASVNTNPLYQIPLISVFPTALVSPILGATMGAYEVWRDVTRTKFTRSSFEQVAALSHQQIRLAEIAAEIDSAELLLRRALDVVRNGGSLPLELRVRNRRDFAYIARLCTDAMERIYNSSGGTANYDINPLQRYWRDIHAMVAHAALNFDASGENFGRVALGLPVNPHEPYF